MSARLFKTPSQHQPPQPRRVVVTGIGAVTPLGLTADETWANALRGKSGAARITRFEIDQYDVQFAAEVKGFSPDPHINKKDQKKMDLFIQLAIASADMAMTDSQLIVDESNRDRIAVYVGTGIGGLPGIENQHEILRSRGPSRVSPFFIPMVIANLAGGQIAMKHGLRGPNFCITSACATGAHAIGEATSAIQRGVADVVFAGGTESCVCPLAMAGFASMRALSTRNETPEAASRPFDKDRDGFVLGEGSAVLVLESLEHALKRGAHIYGEVTGYGSSCDAYHITTPAPEGEGAARSMKAALLDSGFAPEKIDYINAHGTSTPVGDELESLAVKHVFEAHAKKLIVSSTKSMTGHLLGAAGAVESVMCLFAIRDNKVPPTINLENPSEGCDLDYAPHVARETQVNHAMNNSFGFGGTNATLIFSRYSEQ